MFRLDDLFARAARSPRRILFPGIEDPRMRNGASTFASRGAGTPVVLVSPDAPTSLTAGIDTGTFETLEDRGTVRERIDAALDRSGVAVESRDDPRCRAVAAVRAGLVDGALAAATSTPPETGRAADGGDASRSFLVETRAPTPAGDRVLAFVDAGTDPDPDPGSLEDVARSAACAFGRRTGDTPRVALLSFSTKGSASHARVRAVVEAVNGLVASRPGFEVDGELQLDAALVPEIAARKAPESPVAGRANVLVFPDADTATLTRDIVVRLAGATAIGPLTQGLGVAWNGLSSEPSGREVALTAAVTALDATEAT